MNEKSFKEKEILAFLQSPKFIGWFAFGMVVFFIAVWCLMVYLENKIEILDPNSVAQADSSRYTWEIERFSVAYDTPPYNTFYCKMSGWIIPSEFDIDSTTGYYKIVFKDVNTGTMYIIPTLMDEERECSEGEESKFFFLMNQPKTRKITFDTDYEIYALVTFNGNTELLSLGTSVWRQLVGG